MSQLSLLGAPVAPRLAGIDLRHCPVETLLPIEADLVIADSPWLNREKHGATGAHDHYPGLPVDEIMEHLSQIRAKRLVLWITFPIWTADWPKEIPGWGKPVTGGAWFKSEKGDRGHYGQGFHWAGCAEIILIYTKPNAYNDRSVKLRNACYESPGRHSRKPVYWQSQMISRWCPPGGLVFDPYAGLASVAEATLESGGGRTYLGAEKNAQRHTDGMGLLAQWSAS